MPDPYRLGVDIGTNSLGWCLLRLNASGEPCGILDVGVRIFKDARDPKSKASLAATRRAARAMRRQRDRRLRRKRRLMTVLIKHGLMPLDEAGRQDLEKFDPYSLRAEGLDRCLSLYELGRALFHIGQRRGFRSNLKADRKEKGGTTKQAQQKLREALNGYRTLGEFLHCKGVAEIERQLDGRGLGKQRAVRFRPHVSGTKVEYDLYPTRAMYRDEFDILWKKQVEFGLELSDEARDQIADIVFYQRELRPVPVGKCTFEPDDRRAPEALPIAQRFRILQELNNLEWIDGERRSHRLDAAQRDRILRLLERKPKVDFDTMKKAPEFGSKVKFNLESEKRTRLDGDKVAVEMAKKTRFGDLWWRLPLSQKNAIVERLLEIEGEQDAEGFAAWLHAEWGLTPEQAESVIDVPLPDRHYRLGRVAIRKLLPLLEAGKRYYEAATEVYGDHAQLPDGQIFDELPYYGERLTNYTADIPSASDEREREFGRLANPTVHVALNQLRRVINELIEVHGPPTEIVVELARELPLGKEDLQVRETEQRHNQDRNEKLRQEIESLLRDAGASEADVASALSRGDAVLRMRLWKELGRPPDTRCPYTLEQIGIRRLFSHEVHIDHILPFTRTHDDSYANKTVCLRRANDTKGNKTPWEAFHGHPHGYEWERILLQSENLPKSKRWRFAEDSMLKFKRLDRFGVPKELADQFTEQDDFLARHLIDTQYLARVTREYLTAVCGPRRVWPITGGTTALLRGKWNLSAVLPTHNRDATEAEKQARKSRLDHRHHAVDAFVVACTSRSMLQRIAGAADDERDRLIEKMPDPWPSFDRNELRDRLQAMIVSFRSDHGSTGKDPRTGRARTTGALHNDTAYFPLAESDADGTSRVVSRKSIASFEKMDEVNAVANSDPILHDRLAKFVSAAAAKGMKIKDACGEFVKTTGIRKVRIVERLKVVPIRDRHGRIYKAYKGDSNDYMEAWRLPDGKWVGQIVSTFDANQVNGASRRRPHPAAKLLMRLHNDDLVRLVDERGEDRTMRIVKMSKQNVVMADHYEAGKLKERDASKTDPFKYFARAVSSLKTLKFRKLHVSPTGRVRDPGPPS